jgi:hypothetical protein
MIVIATGDAMTLTAEQRQAIDRGESVSLVVDGISCVVIRSDVFQRVYRDGGDWTHGELRQALAKSTAENGWDEPGMDAYDALVP